MERKLLTAITRKKTINIGNEALSSELINILQKIALPSEKMVKSLERAPKHLSKFSWQSLNIPAAERIAKIEGWISQLSHIEPVVTEKNNENGVQLVFEKPQNKKIISIKERLQLRRIAAELGFYRDEFSMRLGDYSRSSCVILNPAGELNPHSIDPPLRMMMELMTAKRMGSRVGVVNFSYEITQPELAPVFGYLFNQCDFVCIRDSLSKQILLDSGVSNAKITLVPDLVFMAEPCKRFDSTQAMAALKLDPHSSVAVVINGKTGLSSPEDWVSLIELIHKTGKKAVLMSNELSSDLNFLKQVAAASGALLVDRQYSYKEYSALLSKFSLVVSNRLHTCILAMVAGTPVVAIEPILRKVRGALFDVGYPLPVPSVREQDWVMTAWQAFQRADHDRNQITSDIRSIVMTAREKISENYAQLIH